MKTKKQPTAAAATTSAIYDVAPSQNWSRAMPPRPEIHVKITKGYVKHVARDAFFWTWPLVNIYNRRLVAEKFTELAYAGPVTAAPLNRIVMLTDYIAPDERIVNSGYLSVFFFAFYYYLVILYLFFLQSMKLPTLDLRRYDSPKILLL